MAFFTDINVNTFLIPSDQFSFSVLEKLFVYLKMLINIFINDKYYEKIDTEKVDWHRLYYP